MGQLLVSLLLVGMVSALGSGARRPRSSRAGQLHLAEASQCDMVTRGGLEYLVVRDDTRVRVVSLVDVTD